MKKNILLFPCGSEVALEAYRSLEHSIHFNLIGASSVDDHGKFVFENYIGDLPNIQDENFIATLKKIVQEYQIDAILPAMDAVIYEIKKQESELGCKVISSSLETVTLCNSKQKTYKKLKDCIKLPKQYDTLDEVTHYPVFLKPDVGYGSRNVLKATNFEEASSFLDTHSDMLILEFLPGKEYTIDCFSDFNSNLLFVGARERKRVNNGISVNTATLALEARFYELATKISKEISFNGAWFFQVKEDVNGALTLLEIASRIGGSSSLYRAKGINFVQLSIFNIFEQKVEILENNFHVELDRALDAIYKIDMQFNHVYVDLDDTLLVDNKVNHKLVGQLYSFINSGKKIHLITKHIHNLEETLLKFRLNSLFDSLIHLEKTDKKSDYIKNNDAIFIDDSFAERKDVFQKLNIPVFGLDIICSVVY